MEEESQDDQTTWQKTVLAETEVMELSWGEAQRAAKDRTLWRSTDVAYVPLGMNRISR